MRNKIIIVVSVTVILILVFIGVFYWSVKDKIDRINYINIDESKIEINEGIKESLEGYRNIALLGIDSIEDTYGLGNRTDCIIIASINEKSKEVKLVSVHRDTLLEVPGHEFDKVNNAYEYDGPILTLSTLNRNLDLDITEFITVNFNAMAEAINVLGGIELEITDDELGVINDYIKEVYDATGIETKEITSLGKQTLDGVQAVAYSRIRDYSKGWDSKRTIRMRKALFAIIDKAKTKNYSELNKFANQILPKVFTNIDYKEMKSLMPQMATYKLGKDTDWPNKTTKLMKINNSSGAYPVTLESNVKELHKELFKKDNYKPTETVKRISEDMAKKTEKK